ncbi:Oxo-4-hydroxy-4-carboxy-5-ureidoimidazoline decarboxylase [Thermoascus aurantiacus ATCC 26904]
MSSAPTLPPISSLPSLPQEAQFRVLDTLFEPSPELHTLMAPVLANQTFSSYAALIDAVGGRMAALHAANSPRDKEVLEGILGSHPRLGESSPAAKEKMSELSRAEQANLNAGGEDVEAEREKEQLRALNREYEERFPGLRYVVFVNGRGRDVIMQDMRRRIDRGDIEKEKEEIIQAMCDIAKDRARKLQQQ